MYYSQAQWVQLADMPNSPMAESSQGFQSLHTGRPLMHEDRLVGESSDCVDWKLEQLPDIAEHDLEEEDGPKDALRDDPELAIGSFHHNGKFKCLQRRCARKSFGRPAELKRHYDTIHAVRKPAYWCREPMCQRSRANGGYPFHRNDKLRDHMRKVHGFE